MAAMQPQQKINVHAAFAHSEFKDIAVEANVDPFILSVYSRSAVMLREEFHSHDCSRLLYLCSPVWKHGADSAICLYAPPFHLRSWFVPMGKQTRSKRSWDHQIGLIVLLTHTIVLPTILRPTRYSEQPPSVSNEIWTLTVPDRCPMIVANTLQAPFLLAKLHLETTEAKRNGKYAMYLYVRRLFIS